MVSEAFLDKVRHEFDQLLNHYVDVGKLADYILMPAVKDNGSATLKFALALNEYNK